MTGASAIVGSVLLLGFGGFIVFMVKVQGVVRRRDEARRPELRVARERHAALKRIVRPSRVVQVFGEDADDAADYEKLAQRLLARATVDSLTVSAVIDGDDAVLTAASERRQFIARAPRTGETNVPALLDVMNRGLAVTRTPGRWVELHLTWAGNRQGIVFASQDERTALARAGLTQPVVMQ